jgi:hypothetical protein
MDGFPPDDPAEEDRYPADEHDGWTFYGPPIRWWKRPYFWLRWRLIGEPK